MYLNILKYSHCDLHLREYSAQFSPMSSNLYDPKVLNDFRTGRCQTPGIQEGTIRAGVQVPLWEGSGFLSLALTLLWVPGPFLYPWSVSLLFPGQWKHEEEVDNTV